MANTHDLTRESEADALIDGDQPAWIFKHSTACPISAAARRQFDAFRAKGGHRPAGVVTVQTDRPVSNHIAERIGVRHATPQAMLVRAGEVLWHASHGAITEDRLRDAEKEAAGVDEG